MKYTALLKNKFVLIGVGVFIVLAAAVPSVYFYGQYQKARAAAANPTEAAKQEGKAIVDTVGKLMMLPTDEDPTIATVSDVTKLADQPFFTYAANGDRVLIYTKAKKAILYRPGTNKIVEVATINLGNTQATSSSEIAQVKGEQTYTAVLRNGTSIVGLTKKVEDALKIKAPGVTVSQRQNASRRDWTTSILVDVSGTKPGFAQQLAGMLGISVGSMPKEEASISADFLIILGTDQK